MPRLTVHAAVPLQPAARVPHAPRTSQSATCTCFAPLNRVADAVHALQPGPRASQPLPPTPAAGLRTRFMPHIQGLAPTRPRPVAAFNLTAHFPCASSCPVATSRANSPAPRQLYVPQPARAWCPSNAHLALASRTRPTPNSQLAHT